MFELAFAACVSDAERSAARRDDVHRCCASRRTNWSRNSIRRRCPSSNCRRPTFRSYPAAESCTAIRCPKEWGVDPQVAVNAGLTDKFVAVSTMPKTTERLLQETTPELDTSLKLDRPAAMVTHIEFAKMIDAIRPWIDYGIDVATGKAESRKKGRATTRTTTSRPSRTRSCCKWASSCRRSISSWMWRRRCAALRAITYEEDGVWVTHSETHIQDLK